MDAPRRIADLPGPRGLPLLGNALQIDREQLHRQVEQWAADHGPAYRLRIGGRVLVVLSDPEQVAAVLRDRPDGFERTQRLTETAAAMGFGGLFSSNGAAWKRQRPMVLAGLDPARVKAFFPTLASVTARFARRWQRAAETGAAIDLQSDLMRYTVDVTAGLAFGVDIDTITAQGDDRIQTHLDKILPALFGRLMSPLPPRLHAWLSRDRRELARHLDALRTAVDGFIAGARRRLADDPARRERPANLIEAMVVERDRDGGSLTDEDVSGNVLTMLLAGEDTTANTLAWLVWLLHRNPAALRSATAEVDAVLAGAPWPPAHGTLARLDTVEACIHETMRLEPVAPLIIVQAAQDRVVGGVALPARTLVMCAMRPAAVSEAHFADAQAFRPERWLAAGADGAAAASPRSAKRVAMPFGAGPRICPGRYLALAEMKMVAAMLLSRFTIESVTTPDGGPVQERLALTMSPHALTLRLGLRGPALATIDATAAAAEENSR